MQIAGEDSLRVTLLIAADPEAEAKGRGIYRFMSLNTGIFFLLNSLAYKNNILDGLWVFLAKYAIFLFGIAMIYALLKDRRVFYKLALSSLIALIIVTAIKNIWHFPRPFLEEKVNLLITHAPDSAFPSKHTVIAFVIAFGIFLEKKTLGIWLLFLALLVAVSRVITGVHYPRDVLGGGLIGILTAFVFYRFFPKHKPSDITNTVEQAKH